MSTKTIKVVRGVSLVLGLVLMGTYALACVIFWLDLYGPIGALFAMLTLPLSSLIASLYFVIQDIGPGTISSIAWFGLGVLFYALGQDS